jgi:hypothetical protein
MKPWFAFLGLCFVPGLLNPPTASGANTNFLVGTWETRLIGPGRDRATCYLTFSDDLACSGYGIALKSFGPVGLAGTWGVGAKGDITGSFTEHRDDGDLSVTLTRFNLNRHKIRGSAFSSQGRVTLKGDALSTPPDVTGSNWVGEVRTRGNISNQIYAFTASTNAPGWYDVTGTGIGEGGLYTISGALVVTSDRNANGYFVSDFGSGGATSTWSFAGRFVPSLERATLRGQTDTGHNVRIRLTSQ